MLATYIDNIQQNIIIICNLWILPSYIWLHSKTPIPLVIY